MPTLLPEQPRAKMHAQQHAKPIEQARSIDRVGLVALSTGLGGLLLATIVYLAIGDAFLVSYIMIVAAAVVALILRWDVDPREPD